ncbi:MAG: hypothetical protein WC931_04645 [Bacilli bacterium]|jgi:hypothetical protein|nr:extracellular solute-binding protein [Bacilli bacterium]
MKKEKLFIITPALVMLLVPALLLTSCDGGGKKDEYDGDKLIVSLRNLYFDAWSGGDNYTDFIEDTFKVKLQLSNYSWADWTTQVNGAINGNNVEDVFHFNLDSYNFASTYEYWADGEIIKALPDDMTSWPNLNSLLENTSNIDALKINGKLYGIPIAKNIENPETTFSPFTYIYRRDWARDLGVYKENDIYTWTEFNALLHAFNLRKANDANMVAAIGDVEWGFPSVTNFYKESPHCFTRNTQGDVISNFHSDKYIEGLNKAKDLVNNQYYYQNQYSSKDGEMNKRYASQKLGVLYENLSYTNYNKLRTDYIRNYPTVNVDDATALMKVKGPDGKFALEGTENWFSMTFFDAEISETKQRKILDIMDWLISEEGTHFAMYGIEGYDYDMINDEPVLKDVNEYKTKTNGAKYLRYMTTLGYDTHGYDPLVNQDTLAIINDWTAEMSEALTNEEMRIFEEDPDIRWLSSPLKNQHSGRMLSNANSYVTQYAFNTITSIDAYKAQLNRDPWESVLAEINAKVG